jgi:ribosomal-protein-alanine N-acetyltransferase
MTTLLDTPRLRLRAMVPDDLDVVAAMLADPEVMRFWPRPFTRDEVAGWIQRQLERYAASGHGYWLAERTDTGEPVGQYGLIPTRPELQEQGIDAPDLGYMTRRPYWRQGYALEAATACLGFAFDRLAQTQVYALIRPENGPSLAVASALGLVLMPKRRVVLAGFEHEVFSGSRG